MHQSVGIIIRNKKNKIPMLDRKNYPYGWACPVGHLDKEEEAGTALIRETKEEISLTLIDFKLLIHEYVDWNECSYGVRGHDWYVYQSYNWKGQVKKEDKEAKKNRLD